MRRGSTSNNARTRNPIQPGTIECRSPQTAPGSTQRFKAFDSDPHYIRGSFQENEPLCISPVCNKVPNAPVSGTVTLDGRPMPQGTIEFGHPESPEGSKLSIKDGKFSGNAPIEECAVKITNGSEGAENTIPAKWNDESTMTANVQKDGSANKFDFKITSK